MNILISSVGRQVFLTNAFREALNGVGYLYVTDYNKNAPALAYADRYFISPPYASKDHLPWLLDLCKKHEIKMLFTLNVDELLILESNRNLFSDLGCYLIGGDIDIIRITYDKYALYQFCNKIGLNSPKTYLYDDLFSLCQIKFPLIAKPRYGKGSRGQIIIHNIEELQHIQEKLSEKRNQIQPYIFQQFIEGVEFGLDVINNLQSKYVTIFVRKKLAMKNGETFEAVTQQANNWEEIGIILSQNLKHQGIVDIDIIAEDNKKYIIDINHRFGGGYIFSHIAGAHLPKVFTSWIQGGTIQKEWLNPLPDIHSVRDNFGIKIIYK